VAYARRDGFGSRFGPGFDSPRLHQAKRPGKRAGPFRIFLDSVNMSAAGDRVEIPLSGYVDNCHNLTRQLESTTSQTAKYLKTNAFQITRDNPHYTVEKM
jgi:hypothetical protein